MKRYALLSFLFCLGLLCGGHDVLAIGTTILITPDKAFYHPGEPVVLTVQTPLGSRVEARISHLTDDVITLSAPLENGAASLTWTPPAVAPVGYGIDVTVFDADDSPIASTSSAFDVLERWIQAPRYGFLSEFTPGRENAAETMALLMRYHVNGLQFYDWQYRHDTLMPTSEPYEDILGRRLSLVAVESLIAAAHARSIAAMPYSAIYGASPAFYNAHPNWAMFESAGKPFDFANGLLMIMDPTPGSPWADHLLNETAFDGIHIDQYGAPMRGYNAAGESVHLDQSFPAFINATADVVDELRGEEGVTIFNLVRNWPVTTVAPSNQDAVYIEVWDPYRHFMDLSRIVTNAQALSGGKPVIIAAYIHPDSVYNARLANALIFASGGYQLELGEPNGVLADPYFPLYGLMDEAALETKRAYYDFLVRYENVLALGTADATPERAAALTIDGVETGTRRSRDRVAVIVRAGENRETFSLVNLMGIDGDLWDVPLTHGPTPLHDLPVSINVEHPVTRVWLASPDADPAARPLDFTTGENAISFTVPDLAYWSMIVVEYAS